MAQLHVVLPDYAVAVGAEAVGALRPKDPWGCLMISPSEDAPPEHMVRMIGRPNHAIHISAELEDTSRPSTSTRSELCLQQVLPRQWMLENSAPRGYPIISTTSSKSCPWCDKTASQCGRIVKVPFLSAALQIDFPRVHICHRSQTKRRNIDWGLYPFHMTRSALPLRGCPRART